MNIPKRPILVGKRIVMRKLKLADALSIVKNANDIKIVRYMGCLPYPYTLKDAKQWIRKTWREQNGYSFGITLNNRDQVIGGTSIHHFEKKTEYKIAVIGYWLGRKYWRKGYGKESVALLIDFCFNKLDLQKICAEVHSPNIASRKILESIGFKREGVLRKQIKDRFGKGWFDMFYYGLLREEYKNLIEKS